MSELFFIFKSHKKRYPKSYNRVGKTKNKFIMKNLKKLSRENLRTIKGGAMCLGCGCATNGAKGSWNGACVVCENHIVVSCPIEPCELCG